MNAFTSSGANSQQSRFTLNIPSKSPLRQSDDGSVEAKSQHSGSSHSSHLSFDLFPPSSLGKSGDSFSDLSPRLATTSTEHSIIGLDDLKRDLQIANQCQDQNEIKIHELDIKLDTALELKGMGKLAEARDVYSEVVNQCEAMGITNIKDPILREAIWGLQSHCLENKSHDLMLAASSRPDRVAAQHQLGLTYLVGDNPDEATAFDLLIRAADKNYTPALHTLIDLANDGSNQAEKCLLKLVYKKSELASHIIEKQLDVDIEDEFIKKEMMRAIADGEKGNIHAIELIEEQALINKKFALYFFAEQMGKGKGRVINEEIKEKISRIALLLNEETNPNKTDGNCKIS